LVMNLNYNRIRVPSGSVIMNVTPRRYGVAIRNGDMIGLCNIVEHLRQREKRQDIKIHIEDGTIHKADFRFQFRDFLMQHTDYLSNEPGGMILDNLYIWNYRRDAGDYVKIKNPHPQKKKICITPVFDAQYNKFRNWSIDNTQKFIDQYSIPEFDEYEKVFCGIVTPSELNYRGFVISKDFIENLNHVMESEIYIGGDTGMSHFAGSLDPYPKTLIYYLHENWQKINGEAPLHYKSNATILNYV